MEEWIVCIWNPEKYEVNYNGEVRNRITGRILKPGHTKDGYLQVVLYDKGVKKTFRLHRLIWESYYGPIPNGYEINHLDENKTNCHLSNLSLVTRKENINWGTKIQRTANSLCGKHINREDQSKPIKQYSLDGKYIATYPSTMEAERQNPGLFHTAISACCKGKVKTHGGYIWLYE